MGTTLAVFDNEFADRFKKAVAHAHSGHMHGNVAHEVRTALENHIKLMEAKKK